MPLFYLACFIHKYKSLQAGQIPWENLPFLQNLLNFMVTKNLKQEVHEDLSVWVNEQTPCGLSIIGDKDSSMSCDQKVMMLLTQWRKTMWTFIQLFLLPKFDNSSPSVTRGKEICQSHMIMSHYLLSQRGQL